MSSYIEKIYELTNSTILTPSNLLNNIKLENYTEVKYYKQEDLLICKMTSIEENDEVHYLYKFDSKDKLQQATIIFGLEEMEIFNRNKELNLLLLEYGNQRNKKLG